MHRSAQRKIRAASGLRGLALVGGLLGVIGAPLAASAQGSSNYDFATDGQWYMRTGIGLLVPQNNELDVPTSPTVDYEAGFSLTTGLGYSFNEWVSAEGQMAVGVAEVDDIRGVDPNADLNYLRWTINAIGTVPDIQVNDVGIFPHAGFGIGLAWEKIDFDEREAAFTLQVEVGVAVEVTEHVAIGPSYRFQFDTFDGDGSLKDDQISHVINLVNVTYVF